MTEQGFGAKMVRRKSFGGRGEMARTIGEEIRIAAVVWAATELTKLTATRMVTADFDRTFESFFRRIAELIKEEFPEEGGKAEKGKS